MTMDILQIFLSLSLTVTVLKPDHSGQADRGPDVARVFILSLKIITSLVNKIVSIFYLS